jgi:hypothetical protein
MAPKTIGSNTILKTLFVLFMGCVFELQPQKGPNFSYMFGLVLSLSH